MILSFWRVEFRDDAADLRKALREDHEELEEHMREMRGGDY